MKRGKISEEEELEQVLNSINKKFGSGSIMILDGDDAIVDKVDVISTGSIGLDRATKIGGIPRGRISEVYGKEMSGKTFVCLNVIAQAQKQGLRAAFIDAEHALSINFAKVIGVDIGKLIISQPDYGEQALDIANELVVSKQFGIIVIDSVAALVPKVELEASIEDVKIAPQAKMMTRACKVLAGQVSKTNTALMFVNQIRQRIGHFIGNPNTTTGGTALGYFTSIRLDVIRKENILEDGRVIGHKTLVKVAKNKHAPPFGECIFDNIYGQPLDPISEILDLAELYGIVEKAGVWYKYKGEGVGQGRQKAIENLKNDVDMLYEIKDLVHGMPK